MRAEQIVAYARDLRKTYQTKNPYLIAEKYGIKIHEKSHGKDFKGYTLKLDGYPTMISINQEYTDLSKRVVCAHELGHALLHSDFVNHFQVTEKNINSKVEYEANLFAVGLLCDDEQFIVPVYKMDNTMLKAILDFNLHFK